MPPPDREPAGLVQPLRGRRHGTLDLDHLPGRVARKLDLAILAHPFRLKLDQGD